MPTQPYYIDGVRVPGTTTIINKFKSSEGLMHWAWTQGIAGKDYRQARDKAADTGTHTHYLIECAIRGTVANPPVSDDSAVYQSAEKAFRGYQEWRKTTHLVPANTELALVSRKYRYGGTLDAMLIQDKLALGDWKTSNAIYPEYLVQLAAYKNLWEENFPDQPITGGLHLLRVSKEGDFHHHWWAELDDAWELFKHFRASYDLIAKLKGRV